MPVVEVSYADIDAYKALVIKSLKYNRKKTLLGSTTEDKYILLTELFHETWQTAAKSSRPPIVRMLISNSIDKADKLVYSEYLRQLSMALREQVPIRILLMDNASLKNNLLVLKNYDDPNKDLMEVKIIRDEPENLVFYKGKSLQENQINFEIFGDQSYRVELLKEGGISICNFENPHKVGQLSSAFDKAYTLAHKTNLSVAFSL